MKKKVKAIISKSDTGFVIMMEGFDWAMSYGDTLEEAKADFEKFPQEYIEMSKEAGKEIPPELNNGELEFEYVYNLSGFFKQFPFISATALAKRLGINEGLMRRYKSGCAPVGEMQKKKILDGIHAIGKELLSVQF